MAAVHLLSGPGRPKGKAHEAQYLAIFASLNGFKGKSKETVVFIPQTMGFLYVLGAS